MKKFLAIISALLLVTVLSNSIVNANVKKGAYEFSYPIYLNGNKVELKEGLFNNNKTYIGLREFCNKAGMDLEWVNPNHHQSPVPGRNLSSGTDITNPSFVYAKEVTNYQNTDKKIKGVDITGIYNKYKDVQKFKYYFNDNGLVIDTKKQLELNYNPSNGYIYVSVEEFREKIQPYFVDICMQ